MAVSSINVVGEGRTLWDPLDSLDWDKESYSRDAIFRIKRFDFWGGQANFDLGVSHHMALWCKVHLKTLETMYKSC